MPVDLIDAIIAGVFVLVWLMVWQILSSQRNDRQLAGPLSPTTRSPMPVDDTGHFDDTELVDDVGLTEEAEPTSHLGQRPRHGQPLPPLPRPLSVRNQKPSVHP